MPEGNIVPGLDIVVTGTTIPATAIAAEMQLHPADSAEAAWQDAAGALVVRALLAREIHLPAADEAACRRWHAAHPERFGEPE